MATHLCSRHGGNVKSWLVIISQTTSDLLVYEDWRFDVRTLPRRSHWILKSEVTQSLWNRKRAYRAAFGGRSGVIWGDLETYWSDLGWPGDVLRWSGMIWGRSGVTWDWCKVWHFSWVILLALFLSGVRFGIFLIKEIKGTNVSSDNFLIAVTESICISWALNRLLAFVV